MSLILLAAAGYAWMQDRCYEALAVMQTPEQIERAVKAEALPACLAPQCEIIRHSPSMVAGDWSHYIPKEGE